MWTWWTANAATANPITVFSTAVCAVFSIFTASAMADAFSNWLHSVFVAQFDAWILLGFFAQGCFTMRFVVQWIASEKAKRSVVPVTFWFFSLFGGVLLFIYAIVRKDPVFIAGQGL
eukprot:gene29143-35604_t